MRFILSIILLFSISFNVQASVTYADAEKAYEKKDYNRAAQIYKECFGTTEDDKTENALSPTSDAYYNLGNCYYRLKDYGHAVLYYQKALKKDPSNKDALFNLELTQAKLTDQFDNQSEMFFISWFKSVVSSQSHVTWGICGLILIIMTFVFITCFILGNKLWIRKVGFFGAIIWGCMALISETFGFIQYNRFQNVEKAVVMQTVMTYDTPTITAQKQDQIHEGTTIIIKEHYNKEWIMIELPDGSELWIKNQGFEMI